MSGSPKTKSDRIVDIVLTTVYLASLLSLAILVIIPNTSYLRISYGCMLLIAFLGQGFYLTLRLIPNTDGQANKMLGIGRMIFSISLALFFSIFLWINRKYYLEGNSFFFMFGLVVALICIVICFFKGNKWEDAYSPRLYLLLRNAPIILLILLSFIAVMLANNNSGDWSSPMSFSYLPLLAIGISFSLVEFLGKKHTRIRYLMVIFFLSFIVLASLGLSM